MPDIEHANGPHEVELRPADIDVGAVFGEMKGVVSPHEVAPSGAGAIELVYVARQICMAEKRG